MKLIILCEVIFIDPLTQSLLLISISPVRTNKYIAVFHLSSFYVFFSHAKEPHSLILFLLLILLLIFPFLTHFLFSFILCFLGRWRRPMENDARILPFRLRYGRGSLMVGPPLLFSASFSSSFSSFFLFLLL